MAHKPETAAVSPTTDWWWVFDPRLSLRARTALVVGGGTLLLVLLVAWLAGQIFRRHITEQFGLTFESLALQVSDRLDRQLYERYAALQLTATQPALRRADASVAEKRQALEAVLHGSPDFGWLGVTDTRGQIVAATERLFEKADVSGVPWFVVGHEKPYVGRVHAIPELARIAADADDRERFIDFGTPVTTGPGAFQGVLGAHVRTPSARDIQLSVLSENARRARLGVTVYGAAGEVLLDSSASGWTEPPVAPSVREPRGSMIERTGLGTTYFTAYMQSRGFRDFPGLGWLVIVRQPIAQAFAPAVRIQREIAAWGLALVAALTALSWWYAGRFVRRMARIETAARLLQQGDVLTVLPHSAGEAEIDRMSAALSDLVEELRTRRPAPAEPPPSETRPW